MSQVEDGVSVVSQGLLQAPPLLVLLGDGDEDHPHHEDHQADGEQGGAQDVGHLPAVAGEVQAADDDAARQEAASRRHEVHREPEDLAAVPRGLRGPDGLAAGQGQHGAAPVAGGSQLIPGPGYGALPQGDVLRTARHGLLPVGGGKDHSTALKQEVLWET